MKIENFEILNKVINASVDFDINSINSEELNLLKEKILSFHNSILLEPQELIKKHYNLLIPNELLKEILTKNIQLSHTIYFGKINENNNKEILINLVLEHIGIYSKWPSNLAGTEDFKLFSKELSKKIEGFGISFVN